MVSLFLILMIGFVSGMYVANESMMTAADEGVSKYKLEDGHFELKRKQTKHCLMQLRQAIKQMSDSITLMRQKRSWIKKFDSEFEEKFKKNLMRSLKQNLGKNLMQSSSQNLMFLLMHR